MTKLDSGLKIKVFVIAILLLVQSYHVAAQRDNIDSLKRLLETVRTKERPTRKDIGYAIILSDHYSKVNFDTSKIYGLIAYDMSVRAQNDTGIAISLNGMGMLYQICGYLDSAYPYLDSSLAMFRAMGDSTGMVFVRNNMAISMMRRGNYAEALKLYQENLDVSTLLNEPKNMILSLNNMGITYFDWKKYDLALKYYRLGLELLSKIGEEERTGPIFNNIGEAYLEMQNPDSALIYFQKALDVNMLYGKKRSILISTTNIGNVFFEKENYTKALENYNQALRISKSIPDDVNTALINVKIGLALNSLGEFETARRYLNEGLMMSQDDETTNTILQAYVGLIENARGLKDPEDIYKYGMLYIALKDSLFNESSLNKITELEAKYETARKEKEIVVLKADQQYKDLEIQLQKNLKYSLAILLIVLIFTAILVFIRYKIKKEKEKSEIEKAKLLTEQRLLHSQMNPHFIFNSLNSINFFIGNNNSEDAQNYLIKFARLMRLILENSRKTTVALIDEISAIRLNLELEKLRFDDRFDFRIDVDDKIDTAELFIPPMLIQPFVENAVKHGIKGKDATGLIVLSFFTEEGLLVCTVEDNGVGRELKKHEEGLHQHVSLGTQVTLERLEILKSENHGAIGLEIIDLKDENDIGTGTKVIIRIPYDLE